jgi:hypothetical protein
MVFIVPFFFSGDLPARGSDGGGGDDAIEVLYRDGVRVLAFFLPLMARWAIIGLNVSQLQPGILFSPSNQYSIDLLLVCLKTIKLKWLDTLTRTVYSVHIY